MVNNAPTKVKKTQFGFFSLNYINERKKISSLASRKNITHKNQFTQSMNMLTKTPYRNAAAMKFLRPSVLNMSYEILAMKL